MKQPIRLLFTIPNFDSAGSGLVVIDILKRLDREAFEPHVCVLKRGGIDHLVEALDVPIHVAPFSVSPRPRLTLPGRIMSAAGVMAPVRPDIQHSWHYLDDYTEPLIARRAGVRAWIYTKKNMSWGGNGWRLRSLLADRIAVNNPEMAELFFRALWFRRKCKVVRQGVDVERFFPQPRGGHLRSRFGIHDRDLLIGYVARVTHDKDQLTAVRSVAAATCKAHLTLIGPCDPRYVAEIRQLGHDLGVSDRIHLTGEASNEELPALLADLDMFVFTSLHDALPVSLLEAMACAKACIATRCGGPSAVISDGDDGVLVEIGDHCTIASEIDRLAQDVDQRRGLGERARRKIEARFSVQQQVQGYEELYREVAGASHSR